VAGFAAVDAVGRACGASFSDAGFGPPHAFPVEPTDGARRL
jgi:hypothetical protein